MISVGQMVMPVCTDRVVLALLSSAVSAQLWVVTRQEKTLVESLEGKRMTYLFMHVVWLHLLLWCASGCLAFPHHSCGYSRINKSNPLPVLSIIEPPHRGQGVWLADTMATRRDWAPMRFGVFVEDLKDLKRYCTVAGEKRSDFAGGQSICTEDNILTAKKHSILVNHILPGAIKMKSDRISVIRMQGTVRIPQLVGVCGYFTVPQDHRSKGVTGFDMLLYAAGAPGNGAVAWATSCAQLRNKRPFIGVINYDPMYISHSAYSIRVAVHELTHALGFNLDQMLDAGMITKTNAVDGKQVYVVSSPKTVEMVRKHYGCNSIAGMILEDQGGNGTAYYHWMQHVAMEELMSPVVSSGYYTAITMAALVDLGFYQVDFSKAEPMSWGRNAGCNLLNSTCTVSGAAEYPEMFCTNKSETLQCTADRLGLGTCSFRSPDQGTGDPFQSSEDPRKESNPLRMVDRCPIIRSTPSTTCVDGDESMIPGSRIGWSSRCLKGDSLKYGDTPVGDVCANVRCRDGKVSLQYKGDDTWYPCSDGEWLTPSNKSPLSGGRIACPKYEDVCLLILDLPEEEPSGVSGNGESQTPTHAIGITISRTTVPDSPNGMGDRHTDDVKVDGTAEPFPTDGSSGSFMWADASDDTDTEAGAGGVDERVTEGDSAAASLCVAFVSLLLATVAVVVS